MLKLTITDPSWDSPIIQVVKSVKEIKSHEYREAPNSPKNVANGAESVLRSVKVDRHLLIRHLDGQRERFGLWGEQGYTVEIPTGEDVANAEEEFEVDGERLMCTDPNWMND